MAEAYFCPVFRSGLRLSVLWIRVGLLHPDPSTKTELDPQVFDTRRKYLSLVRNDFLGIFY